MRVSISYLASLVALAVSIAIATNLLVTSGVIQ